MNKRYQLIKPFLSDKIYETSTLNKGAKKCYNEVKSSKIIGATEFSVRDIDSYEIFKFKIHHPYFPMQSGGNPEQKQEQQIEGVAEIPLANDDKLKNMDDRITRLEQYLGIGQLTATTILPMNSQINTYNPIPINNQHIYQSNLDSLKTYKMIKNVEHDNDEACIIL